jgi:EmrB/QacA subfamily drug resistance transporter
MGTQTQQAVRSGSGLVLLTLAAGQFLMTLDSSVMNVSMATVAEDIGTTITGVQTAITLYTLVMATLMITGGKIGTIIGRRRAFMLGSVIYGVGSFVTGLAPNLPVLILGWSVLEGVGAALILPAIVALVAANFDAQARPKAYGMIAASGAVAVALGPLIGGAATTFFSWRYVFFGEVVVVIVILLMSLRIAETEKPEHARLDIVGTVLSVLGLGMAVFGVLRSSEWGWVNPKAGAPALLGVSLTFWLIVAGVFVVWLFWRWERHQEVSGHEPLVRTELLRNRELDGGLLMFASQYLLQAGVFFVVPLFLSVVLALSALETGVRILPLSFSVLIAALGIPRVWPHVSPRLVSRVGILLMLAGILVLMSGIRIDAGAGVVAIPMFLIGLGIGSLASQLGSVTVSAVPDEFSGEVGGLQNTATNLGASLGTALAGSVLIGALTSSFLAGIQQNPAVPADVTSQVQVHLAAGAPFLSTAQLQESLAAHGVATDVADELVTQNSASQVEALDASLAVLALLALLSLFFTGRIPDRQPADAAAEVTDEVST